MSKKEDGKKRYRNMLLYVCERDDHVREGRDWEEKEGVGKMETVKRKWKEH